MQELNLGPPELVATMDQAGVDVALVTAWTRQGKVALSNEKVGDIILTAKRRFQ